MFNAILATAAKAAAPAAEGAAGQATQTNPFGMLILMTGAFILMFWMMSRSNKKQQQRRAEMLSRLTKGTRVIYGGGLIGTIVEVKDKVFVVENIDNSRCEVIQNGIADVYEPAAQTAGK